jgi:predicted GH43/DUF377 family glycosyl hydrolase
MAIKLTRFKGNPILEAINERRYWWERGAVFNPGAAVGKDGKIYLLFRAAARVDVSSFGLAVMENPFTVGRRYSNPVFEGDTENEYERFGVEDPRITYLEGKYQVVYIAPSLYPGKRPRAWSRSGTPWRVRVSLAQTRDFRNWTRKGVILPGVDSKDATVFPGKIGGKYALLHRIFPDMWISFSSKLEKFSRGEVLCRPRKGYWDNDRIGAGAPPIKTKLGWLLFYHGVEGDHRKRKPKLFYHLGIMLLDLKDPRKILYRSPEPILSPKKGYEKKGGAVPNVVFTCGAVEFEGKYYVYYGAADGKIGVAYIGKEELLSGIRANLYHARKT